MSYEIQGLPHPIIKQTIQGIMFVEQGAIIFTESGDPYLIVGGVSLENLKDFEKKPQTNFKELIHKNAGEIRKIVGVQNGRE